MKVILHSSVAAPSLIGRYRFAEQALRGDGFDVEICTGRDVTRLSGSDDVLISHNWISEDTRAQAPGRCYGGKGLTRPEHLTLMASLGFPTMEWTTVPSCEEAMKLCSSWNVDRLILKRSFTGGGHGFHVITPGQSEYREWDYARDVICKEVNPNSGNVFKAELFGGKLMLGFVLKKEPLQSRLLPMDQNKEGTRQLATYRDAKARPDERHREVWNFTDAETSALEELSAKLTDHGIGYVSVDLMRRPDGQLVAIELNTGNVTCWWSETFPFVRERFAAALVNLVRRI